MTLQLNRKQKKKNERQKIIIHVTQITPYALSEEGGMKLYKKIIKELPKEEIAVDFSGISLFAPPFFNAAFGRLIIENGPDVFEKIKITNLDDLGKETLKHTEKQVIELSEKNTKRISEIVKKNIYDS